MYAFQRMIESRVICVMPGVSIHGKCTQVCTVYKVWDGGFSNNLQIRLHFFCLLGLAHQVRASVCACPAGVNNNIIMDFFMERVVVGGATYQRNPLCVHVSIHRGSTLYCWLLKYPIHSFYAQTY